MAGRKAFGNAAWAQARDAFACADAQATLAPADLERWATAAYLVGNEREFLRVLARAHSAYEEQGEDGRAIRCAFWLGLISAFRKETGPAAGWFARAQAMLEETTAPCAEVGFLLLPSVEQSLHAGKCDLAFETASRARQIAEQFNDRDLFACACHLQGRALIGQMRVEEGLAFLDEAMVAVVAGELTQIMTGLIYCSVIDCCRGICAFDRASSWTAALANWCAPQPQLVAFTGDCLVNRAEIMLLRGDWDGALAEADRARMSCEPSEDLAPPALAHYQRGEVCRLRGEFDAAEAAYREANLGGYIPLPGLALLRLAQGHAPEAATMLRNAIKETDAVAKLLRLLPASVEIELAEGEIELAERSCRQLVELSSTTGSAFARGTAFRVEGAIALAQDKPAEALPKLREALASFDACKAAYDGARTRAMIGAAYDAAGDHENSSLEFEAARAVFARLGAKLDLERLLPAAPAGLTAREMQIARMVADGRTNKDVAAELDLSVRTVERHMENIFAKLGVSSRSAVAAFAFRHGLMQSHG